MKRETAWRVFAGEFNDATLELKGSGEKTPSYVVTPLGARINRVFVVGVLTDVEQVSESGELLRAHVSDPTGVFTLYAGQFQPEATESLSRIEVPAFIAVIGKARTYTPEGGELYVSLRPEFVREVKADVRDRWIVETSLQTKDRIGAVVEAQKMNPVSAYDLRKLGYSKDLSDGVVAALKHYGSVNLQKYAVAVQESLQFLHPGKGKTELKPVTESEPEEIPAEKPEKKPVAKKQKKSEPAPEESESTDAEQEVFQIIKKIEGSEGAAWDEIMKKCKKAGFSEDQIEEALNALMDKGMIYEPILGTIKTT